VALNTITIPPRYFKEFQLEENIIYKFCYMVTVSFIGGGNWSSQRKPWTCRKSLTMNGVRTHNFSGDGHNKEKKTI
jgi:hypothetical protein